MSVSSCHTGSDRGQLSAAHPIFCDVSIHLGPSGLRGDLTNCSICFDKIRDTDLTYRHEECGVAFDYHCLQDHLLSCLVRSDEMKCPVCRKAFFSTSRHQHIRSPHLQLNPEWHDSKRLENGEELRNFEDLQHEEHIDIAVLLLRLAAEREFSLTGAVIEVYARICQNVNVIADQELRMIVRSELVSRCGLVKELDLVGEMLNEGLFDVREVQGDYHLITFGDLETLAQLLLHKCVRLDRIVNSLDDKWHSIFEDIARIQGNQDTHSVEYTDDNEHTNDVEYIEDNQDTYSVEYGDDDEDYDSDAISSV